MLVPNAENDESSCPATAVDMNKASETDKQLLDRGISLGNATERAKAKSAATAAPSASDCSEAGSGRTSPRSDVSNVPRNLSFPSIQPSKFQVKLISALSPPSITLEKSLNGPKLRPPKTKGPNRAGEGENVPRSNGSGRQETLQEEYAEASQTGVQKALLIGMNSARQGEKFKLRFADNDAKRFANCLIKRLGFSEENVRILTDTDPENPALPFETITKGLNWLFDDARSGDTMVLLISGHCVLNGTNKVVSLISAEEHIKPRLIPSTVFRSYFDKLPQGCTVEVVLDCCYSAGLIKLPHLVAKMDMGGGKNANVMSTPSSSVASTSESGCTLATISQESTDQSKPRGNVCHGIAQSSAVEEEETVGRSTAVGSRACAKPVVEMLHVSHSVASGSPDSQSRHRPRVQTPLLMDPPQTPPVPPQPRPQPQPPTHGRPRVAAPPRNFLGAPVQTQANATVWAASGSDQRAFESSNIEGEPTNGILTNAICKVIESVRSATRRMIWDEICRITRLENLRRLENNPEDQEPHLLSSHEDHGRTMEEFAFRAT
ncbi:hypothetical protein FRC08_004126 [Ceratobasidium sp. 394]|nr:hypothetical protein FRC08_004126 [Ceratobasidium sp. 394]